MRKDQAEELRKLFTSNDFKQQTPEPEESKNMCIITVASGKGGVGKTSLVANLALALTKLGKRVLILDADLGMANVDIMYGVLAPKSLYDVIEGQASLKEVVLTTAEGVNIIPGGSGITDLINLENEIRDSILNDLQEFSEKMDYLFIDCGAGVSKHILGYIAAADDVIIVVTPEPTSITDAYGLIKILSRFDVHKEVSLIVNKVNDFKEAENTMNRIENVTREFLDIEIRRMGFIQQDDSVIKSIKEQKPFVISYPRSKAAKNMFHIAESFSKANNAAPQCADRFVKRLLNLFR